MQLKPVTDILAPYGLYSPDLVMLRPDERRYTTLLMQPSGPISATTERIGAFDQAEAIAKGRNFLELAIDRDAHLVVTPEYFLPWDAILKAITDEIVPSDDALWVLGSESITPNELEDFKTRVNGHCLVIYEPLQPLSRSRELLNPVVIMFQAVRSDGSKQLVALIQFKIHASRDPRFFEESVLKLGTIIYQFKGIDSPLTAAVIICADAFALNELSRNSLSAFNNQATLIHIQLNPNPRHIAYREYRTTTFSTDANSTNCHIVCLNWAQSIEAYEGSETQSIPWNNIAGSTWYCPYTECSFDDGEVLPNHSLGLYYAYMRERRHALIFHYNEAVFELLVPKLVRMTSAVLANKNGPVAKERYEWKGETKSWESGFFPVDSGFDSLISKITNAKLALSSVLLKKNVLDVERVLSLSAGAISGKEKWYTANNIDSCQIAHDEVVKRITVVQDTDDIAYNFRHNRFTPLMNIYDEIINQTDWPPQISDVNSQSVISWTKTTPNFNVLTFDKKPTLIVYLGETPSIRILENTVDMFYHLLRKEGSRYQTRLCILYREFGKIKFAPIPAMTRIDDPIEDQTNFTSVTPF